MSERIMSHFHDSLSRYEILSESSSCSKPSASSVHVNKIFYVLLASVFGGMIALCQGQRDLVNGNLIQFNDNGLWCWFQDERVIVDTMNGKMILGTDACSNGVGGQPRNGADEAVIFNLPTNTPQRYILHQWTGNCDDHNVAGFVIRPDGKYLAMYAQHYDIDSTRYRIFDGNSWASEQAYDWRTKPGGTDYTIAYNNVYYLSAENRTYDFTRANHRAPNFLVSNDMGSTWTWGGQLTTNSSNSYNKGYYKYWGNGVDRIDFIFTEQHPRDTTTSIYHGYIKGGKAYKSDGTLVDNNIFDTTYIPTFLDFTKVFAEGTTIGNITMRRCWQSDLMRYDDGTIAAIITARSNQNISYGYPDTQVNPDHSFIYCRYDGTSWKYTYLGKAGFKLYSAEADYTGLGCLCPNDPNTLYISTPYDPRDTTINLGVHEIFKGTTSDNGASWSWTPITQNSVRDNLRPTVPAWDGDNTALLWCRGTYSAAQQFDAAVVGLIQRKSDVVGLMTYVDATDTNTVMADGSPLVATGPDANAGAADNKWHIRTGFGNGGTVLTSAETGGEDAPLIRTRVAVPATGTYDLWINFWGNPSADWRIKAGLSANTMQLFRSMASKEVEAGQHQTALVLSGNGNVFLYQAYIGRVHASARDTINVFVDDYAVAVGTTSPLKGDVVRTWYDGVSYAPVGATTAPLFTLSGKTIGFGTVPTGRTKKDSLLLSNPGTDTLRVSSILSTNPRFIVDPAAMALPPSASAYVFVTFSPPDTSVQIGVIVLTYNASGSPDSVTVTGKGSTFVPLFTVSATAIGFGTVPIGSTKSDTLLLSNPGTDTLRVSSVLSTNPRFTVDTSSIVLAPSASAHLIVMFSPQDTSTQSGIITLTHNASSSPDSVAVSGKGSVVLAVGSDNLRLPKEYALHQNYPNPFNPTTTIAYSLPKGGQVSLKVYNMLGQEIAVLVNREMPAGSYSVTWNAQNAPSGTYFYRIAAGGFSKTSKMVLLK